MTSPKYGQITPLQAYVLHLGGIVSGRPDEFVQEQDQVDSMRRALKKLQKKTGKDFGYDLEKWHQFLQTSHEFSKEYTFDFAWDAVYEAVNELIADQDRLRLVELAQQSMEEENYDRDNDVG